MVDAVFLKPLGILGGILGLLQGITWSVMALLAILMYADAMSYSFLTYTVGETLTMLIAAFFHESNEGLTLTGTDLLVWSILYLLLSLLWTGVSIFLLIVVSQRSSSMNTISTKLWSVTTFLVCALDLSLTIALGFLFDDLTVLANNYGIQFFVAWLASGVLMTVAARGFVLWIVNLLVAIFLLLVRTDNRTKSRPPMNPTQYNYPTQNNPYAAPVVQSPWGQAGQNEPSGHNSGYQQPNNAYQSPSPRGQQDPGNRGFDWDDGSNRNLPRLNPNPQTDYPNLPPIRIPTPDYPNTSPVYGNRGQPKKYQAPPRPNRF